MTYLKALIEAASALEMRRGWYTRTRGRASRGVARARELEMAIERIQELARVARETGV